MLGNHTLKVPRPSGREPDTTAVESTSEDSTAEGTTAEDTTAELYKKGGQYGGTYDSHIILYTEAELGTVSNYRPSLTLCTVQNLISITFIRTN